MAPSLREPHDPAPRPELRWACHPKLPPTGSVGPQAARCGVRPGGIAACEDESGPCQVPGGRPSSPEETRVSGDNGTRSHFSLSTGRRGGAETLRSWRHGEPGAHRACCGRPVRGDPRGPHSGSLTTEHSGGLSKGVWMKGSVRERLQAPHTHVELRVCPQSHSAQVCAGPRQGPQAPWDRTPSPRPALRGK